MIGGVAVYFSFTEQPYIAIIGDMKRSKSLTDRSKVQEKLKITLDRINEVYKLDISSKFMITLGDEFQGLLSSGANIMHIVSEIEQGMYPVRLRFGVGIGSITTKINHDMAIGADGPGYYKARAAVEYLKDSERRKQTSISDIRIEIDGENHEIEKMMNTILSLLTVIKASWSDRQREVIWDMLQSKDSQANVAKRLKIQQPTVQKILANGNYYSVKEAFDTIEKAMEEIRRYDV